MFTTKKWALLSATALAFTCANAHAAGFQLKTQSSALMGVSYAGATAKGEDLSTIFYNPAGMAHIQGNQLEAHAIYIRRFSQPKITGVTSTPVGSPALADGSGGDPSSQNGSVLPAFYGMWDYNEDINFGLAINTPFGLSSEYDKDWAGRFHTVESSIKTITLQPSMSYKMNNKWSFGAGLQLQKVDVKLTRALNTAAATSTPGAPDSFSSVEGDDIAFGYVLGATYQYDDATRFGLSYRSEVQHELKGDVDFSGALENLTSGTTDQDVVAGLNTPAVLSLGAHHKVNENYAVMADVAWTGWSSYEEILIQNESSEAVISRSPQNFDDTMFFSVGLEYTPDETNKYQFGLAYDQGAVSERNRGLSVPDADRTWVSFGYERTLSEKSRFNLGYIYIVADKARVVAEETGSGTGTVSAEFDDTNLHLLSVGYSHKF